ncbi:MAG: EAL domain-containing protein [Venatoribacter sp.]
MTLLASLLTLVVSGFMLLVWEFYQSKQELNEKLQTLSQSIISRTIEQRSLRNESELTEALTLLSVEYGVVRGCVYDAEEKLLASFVRQGSNASCANLLYELEKSGALNYELIQPISNATNQIGVFYIEADYSSLNERLENFLGFALLVLFMAMVLTYLLHSKLAKMIGRPIDELRTVLHDITQRKDYSLRADKQADDEVGDLVDLFNSLLSAVEQEQTSLKTSEERFRQLTALSPVGIFQLDIDQKFRYVNQRWREIMGIKKGFPDNQVWAKLIGAEDRTALLTSWQRLLQNQVSISQELKICPEGKNSLWIQLRVGPLHSHDGALLGYLGAVSDISELKEAQLKMETLALYDPLTGLANRRLFLLKLDEAVATVKRSNATMALMFIDMDHFKRVNDTLGHDAGDILLKEVARRLKAHVRESDTVSRVGGDEFTVILRSIHQVNDAAIVAEKLLQGLAVPIQVKGQTIVPSISIGITMLPTDALDPNVLLKNADLAMYRAKSEGRNNYQFFSEEMNSAIVEHAAMERDIGKALLTNQFTLVFQPKLNLLTSKVNGVEALIRWNHPEKGFISPDQFIPVAEDTGQIVQIGRWVLRESCMLFSQLLKQGLMAEQNRIAVNLSARQFSSPTLIDDIISALRDSDLSTKNLELEVTETTLLHDRDAAIRIMHDLKDLGVSFAIDDFGTGYSSLSFIKHFPINVIKVDRSFVKDIPIGKNDMAITAAVIAMSQKLGLNVVAEGVETKEQLAFLQDNHCSDIQGYLFSRPLSYAQLTEFLSHYQNNFTASIRT